MIEVAYGAGRGALLMNALGATRADAAEPAAISVCRPGEFGRRDAERLIETVYAEKYGARISSHYPNLMSVRSASGETIAAVGFRAAGDERLFLERYLARPVEQAIANATAQPIERSEIVEIGSLAARSNGASLFLFVTLAALLRYRGFTHATVTATRALRRTIESLGFRLMTLGSADPSQLEDRGASWGSYYETHPVIVAGDIAPCFERLAHFLPPDRNPNLADLFAEDAAPESCQ